MGNAVDPTGLSFTVTKVDGTTASVSPQTHTPTTWGDTAGTQTCTFTYSDGYDSVSCEVEATVLAEEVSSIAISGTPVVQIAGASVNTEGLTVTATYNSGRTANVTSSTTFTDFVTGTSTVGDALMYVDGHWEVARTRVSASYEGKSANTSEVYIASPNGTNTAATAYEIENTQYNSLNLDVRGFDESSINYPFNGDMEHPAGFFIDGASAGDFVVMYFTKSQWDNDTAVNLETFAGLSELVDPKGSSDANGPTFGDVFFANSQTYAMNFTVEGTATITEPVQSVSVVGYLANGITAGGDGTIKKSDLVLTGDNAAKVYYVDFVAANS